MKYTSADEVRARIAHLMIPKSASTRTIGQISLQPHQIEGVSRVLQCIDQFGGVLLCDVVGLGKTFTATAVIRHFDSAVVIAPAALRDMWEESLLRSGASAAVMSLERFSRLPAAGSSAKLVVIDEAHHLRNPATRRYKSLSIFVEHSRLLLLSATPIHNRPRDITSLLSLFMGARAQSLTAAEIAGCVIRRQRANANSSRSPKRESMPAVNPPVSLAVRRKLLSLPAPVPPRGGGECAALIQLTLLRQWASSDAALRAGLETRIARAAAMITALEAGTYPTRKELATWSMNGLEVQFAFAELLAAPGGDSGLLQTVRAHDAAARAVLHALNAQQSSDGWRAEYLREVRARYPDRKVVAFTQFAVTARELYRLLRHDPKVALITSGACEIASGRLSRRDVIERFAPRGSGAVPPVEREDISMLLATDLCSEGLNLQDAGVIVHLDMPWTPARVEQRVGRIARQGSPHREIFIHALAIPEIAKDILRIEQRLSQKALISLRMVGCNEERAHGNGIADETSPAEAAEHILGILRGWERNATEMNPCCLVSFCDAADQGRSFLAVVRIGAQAVLICGTSEGITRNPQRLLAVLAGLGTVDGPEDPAATSATITRIRDWLAQNRLANSLGHANRSNIARSIARKINSAARTAPIHSRPRMAAAADRARRTLTGQRTAGLELRLAGLTRDSSPVEQWLGRMTDLGHDVPKTETGSFDESGSEILALLIAR